MNLTSLSPEETQTLLVESDVLAVFRKHKDKRQEIQQGMSPQMIAEIISDHLIEIVKEGLEPQSSTQSKS